MTSEEKTNLRQVFGKFATGVTVVTFCRGDEVLGMTVNSFSSVSLDPPMVLFCPALNCRFAEGAALGGEFTISILSHEQKDVCLHFAGRPNLNDSPWAPDAQVPPAIEGSIAHLRCQTEALHQHGDHYVAVGRVTHTEVTSTDPPLLFFSGQYPELK